MQSIIWDNVKGSELSGKLKTIEPEKRYTVSIQPAEDRAEILAELEGIAIEARPDPAAAGKSEDETMAMVNVVIARYRRKVVQG
ncbi:hypothetical protein EPICR_30325 [Candidatus Desulfarcum epimagneticum]|uniref:Uncharacterized protein n=1 Tax=uncultured Desulfobacteraceae bacterium TaxID=218296 RepID=A0A484HJH7_9BACT|nr:hypothetical protein EPICR_30325 [uncultured Desulfobacteraceae bacterium]